MNATTTINGSEMMIAMIVILLQTMGAIFAVAFGRIHLNTLRKIIRTVIVSLAAAGVFVFLEFALDGRIRPPFAFMEQNVKLCWYIVFGIVLAAYLVYGLLLFRKYGKETPEP